MNIVTLLETLVNSLLDAEDKFFSDPRDLHTLESSVRTATNDFARNWMGGILSQTDQIIRDLDWRKEHYNIQRRDRRSLISSMGEVNFDCTYYLSRDHRKSYTYLLEDAVGIDRQERFTEDAEAAILTEAAKTSYREATKVIPMDSEISVTTVENKVHQIAEEIPLERSEEPKKKLPYLFIEADEDHVAEQHGRWYPKQANGSFLCRLIYIYEYRKESDTEKGRWELVNKFYFGGLYQGSDGIERLWKIVARFIDDRYVTDEMMQIYLSGDGASWIKSGTEWIHKALYCADKFHLFKYINSAAGQMLDEKDLVKEELYKLLFSKNRDGFARYTAQMYESAERKDHIERLQTYVLDNWEAVMRTLHSRIIYGCSAEGHVSHILSDRLSSRPMGWSQTGADRMSKLRIYVKNHGQEKIIDLVKYSRELRQNRRTEPEDIKIPYFTQRQVRTEHYQQSRSYIDRLQARIPGRTSKKSIAIMGHLWDL